MDAEPANTPEVTHQKLRSLGVLWPAEVDRICAAETQTQFVVGGFIPVKGIAIVAGDSTIGKSPLICQLALCVAAGIRFLGLPTTQGCVLYCDLENSLADCKAMRDALVRFLGLDETPEDFLLVTELSDLGRLISEVKPRLVVVDSLRAYRPDVTEKNARAGEWLKEIRRLSRTHTCAFLIVHHLKKPSEGLFGHTLDEDGRVATWMLEMEGPRALVNQTDVRVAVEGGDSNPAALKMKWSRRVHGDSPLVLLERVCDDDGEPAGYRQLAGAALLSPERRAAFDRLPPGEFSFKQAKAAYGRSDDPTNKFLAICRQFGLIEKPARGRYKKVKPVGEDNDRGDRVSSEVSCFEAVAPLSANRVPIESPQIG